MTQQELDNNNTFQFYKEKIIQNFNQAEWDKNAGFYIKTFKEYSAAGDEQTIIEEVGNFAYKMKSEGGIGNPGAYLNKCLQNGLKRLKEGVK